MMAESPRWWREQRPEQVAIIEKFGLLPLDYRELGAAYPSLPKHEIDVAKVHSDLMSRIASASLTEEDVKNIRRYLYSYARKLGWPLWSDLRRNYRALERIASGNLDGHGTEFSAASDFDPSVEDLALEYEEAPPVVTALRAGLYVVVREQGSLSLEKNPIELFRTTGIVPQAGTSKQSNPAESLRNGPSGVG